MSLLSTIEANPRSTIGEMYEYLQLSLIHAIRSFDGEADDTFDLVDLYGLFCTLHHVLTDSTLHYELKQADLGMNSYEEMRLLGEKFTEKYGANVGYEDYIVRNKLTQERLSVIDAYVIACESPMSATDVLNVTLRQIRLRFWQYLVKGLDFAKGYAILSPDSLLKEKGPNCQQDYFKILPASEEIYYVNTDRGYEYDLPLSRVAKVVSGYDCNPLALLENSTGDTYLLHNFWADTFSPEAVEGRISEVDRMKYFNS
jgi:hypothetical protein